MFFDISPLEMVALVVIGIIIFGPERLPKLASDAARMLRRFREYSQNARDDLRRELGPEYADFQFEDLNPKNFIRRNLLADDDIADFKSVADLRDLPELREFRLDDAFALPGRPDPGPRLAVGERPPFDVDAT